MSQPQPSRRSFLRGRSQPAAGQRPPWALPAGTFEDVCTRCDACITACPTHIIQRADGGFPAVDFSRGECTFCGDCVTACRPAALLRSEGSAPWQLIARFTEPCLPQHGVECRVCRENCPPGAIRMQLRAGGPALPVLDEARCTGCGACVAPCPVQAIQVSPAGARP